MKYIIEIDTRQKAAKTFLEFIKSLPFIKSVKRESEPNQTIKKAIEEASKGKTHKISKKSNNIVDDILNDSIINS